jgi:hypothetical protein
MSEDWLPLFTGDISFVGDEVKDLFKESPSITLTLSVILFLVSGEIASKSYLSSSRMSKSVLTGAMPPIFGKCSKVWVACSSKEF